MLLAILVIYFEVGSTDYQVLAVADISETRQRILWLGFFLSFAVKSTYDSISIFGYLKLMLKLV